MDDLTPRMQQEVERRKEDIDRIVLQAENSHLLQAEDGVEEEDSTYQVTVTTGKMAYAGTDLGVSVMVVGDRAATSYKVMDSWGNDFEAGDRDTYEFKDRDVGKIEFIIIKMTDSVSLNGNQAWFLDKVEVKVEPGSNRGHQRAVFPYYQWVVDHGKMLLETSDSDSDSDTDPDLAPGKVDEKYTRRFARTVRHNPEKPLIIANNRTRLPQDESDTRVAARLLQAQQQRELVRWSYGLPVGDVMTDVKDSLPGFIEVKGKNGKPPKYDDLNPKYQWYEEHYKEYRDLRGALRKIFVGQSIWNIFDKINTVDEYDDIINHFDNAGVLRNTPEAPWVKNWDGDAEFGRQTLNGMNPVGIHRIKAIPEKFPVTEKHVAGLLKGGLTLEEEVAAGHVYLVDFEILEGIDSGWQEEEKCFSMLRSITRDKSRKLELAAAMCLFYHDTATDDLLPIAVQLGQTPGPQFPIWTPNDKPNDWLLAKFWFRNADAQVGQLVTHLAHTHFFVEPFAVAMHRCLPGAHPLHKMLKEHLKFIIAVDTRGREVLIAPGGAGDVSLTTGHGSDGIAQLLGKAYKSYSYQDLHYPDDLARRDMMDLPNFHHRDDAIKLWDATIEYVRDMVEAFYESDTAVQGDWELQAWVEDVFTNGFGKLEGTSLPSLGLPASLATREELVMYLQKLIYTGTTRHTFVNFYVFEYTKFAPNSPTVLNGKIPTEEDRGKATLESLLETLPTRKQATIAAATSKVLANFACDEIFLTETPSWMFLEEDTKVHQAFRKFRTRLAGIEEDIVERTLVHTSKSLVPYTILLPSKIPAGIAV